MPRFQHWRTSRRIIERIVIEGDLVLLTPAHFGGGEEGATDMVLLRDVVSTKPLLLGSSVAGALRNYWRERTDGYPAPPESGRMPAKRRKPLRQTDLFGGERGEATDEEGEQSLLIADDAVGDAMNITVRTGVAINPLTRTAETGKLFDMEVLDAGTRFRLRLELVVTEKPRAGETWRRYDALSEAERHAYTAERRNQLCRDLELALQGFSRGEIGMGARKHRGLGRCRVQEWTVWRYDMTTTEGFLAWLAKERSEDGAWSDAPQLGPVTGDTLADKLGIVPDATDLRKRLVLEATFKLESPLLIRSSGGESDLGPDAAHIHGAILSPNLDQGITQAPLVPGTSLAGALRARALRITKVLCSDHVRASQFVQGLFGVGPQDAAPDGPQAVVTELTSNHWASRLRVHEAFVEEASRMIQNRIRIDRFTGGVMDGALFDEAPVFGSEQTCLKLNMELRNPQTTELGLLLLLLKDLWTGDLPLGGTAGIGRGRLKGQTASLTVAGGDGKALLQWTFADDHDTLVVDGDTVRLNGYVTALDTYLKGR